MVNPLAYIILVIDNESSTVAQIRALLQPGSYTIKHFSNEAEVNTFLHLVNEDMEAVELPHVILLCQRMPGLNSADLCSRIKSNAHLRYTPVIMMVEGLAREHLSEALQVGADDAIGTPIDELELRSRLQAILRTKQHYDELLNALQMREDLSNMVVHDLRNPVTNILLSAQLLMTRDTLTAKDHERLQLIQASSKKLRLMIDDLLTVARMQSGRLVLACSEVNLNLLIPYVVENMSAIAEERHIQIQMALREQGRFISVDANLIQRMLENLLSNALKFSPTGSTITIMVDYPASTPTRTRIRVFDEGPGVDQNLRNSIFDKFNTGKKIRDTPQIGLGLTFCRLVVEAHGGRIGVEPNHPQGSVFTVEL